MTRQFYRGFHATKQGERYILSEPARRTALALNHQCYEEELKAGLHDTTNGNTILASRTHRAGNEEQP